MGFQMDCVCCARSSHARLVAVWLLWSSVCFCWFGSSDIRWGTELVSFWMSCLWSHPEFKQWIWNFGSMRECMYSDLIGEENVGKPETSARGNFHGNLPVISAGRWIGIVVFFLRNGHEHVHKHVLRTCSTNFPCRRVHESENRTWGHLSEVRCAHFRLSQAPIQRVSWQNWLWVEKQ